MHTGVHSFNSVFYGFNEPVALRAQQKIPVFFFSHTPPQRSFPFLVPLLSFIDPRRGWSLTRRSRKQRLPT